jgi:ferritin-like metal-binding protein YciE
MERTPVTAALERQLVNGLTHAHIFERQAIRLLDAATRLARDDEIAELYDALLLQACGRAMIVADRLHAYGKRPEEIRALPSPAADQAVSDTPIRLAETAFALESHGAAAYRMLVSVAERAGDHRTAEVARRLLEQAEAAARLVAGTFERAVDVALADG